MKAGHLKQMILISTTENIAQATWTRWWLFNPTETFPDDGGRPPEPDD